MRLLMGLQFLNFHSISFPSEWGLKSRAQKRSSLHYFHSISFPSEWGTKMILVQSVSLTLLNFHSISFPSEWGLIHSMTTSKGFIKISIQLVSPASGDRKRRLSSYKRFKISIQLVSPASGDVGTTSIRHDRSQGTNFHSISFPSEWGRK